MPFPYSYPYAFGDNASFRLRWVSGDMVDGYDYGTYDDAEAAARAAQVSDPRPIVVQWIIATPSITGTNVLNP